MFNIRDMTIHAKAVAEVVKSTIAGAISPIEKRLDAIESLPKAEQIKSDILEEVEALIPQVKDGEPGASVTVDDVAPLIDEAVKSAIPDLSKFVHVDQVEKMIADALARALESIELPKDGENGRDALDIEILPAIDSEKSYPRGTYASHNGGLWKSYQMTVGMKGWECVVDGVSSISVDQKGEREFTIDIERSSGVVVTKSASVPVLIYRGIYSQKEYSPGDTVTWDGSLWHCDEATSDKPGEHESKGWSLCAKRGRNGKDGINGIDKAPRVAK